MSLVSSEFLIFLGLTALVYFLMPKGKQWWVLLAANFLFYAMAGLQYVPFLLFTIVTTHFGGVYIDGVNKGYKQTVAEAGKEISRAEKKELKAAATRRKRRVVVIVCLLNFGLLGVVKYTGFLIDNLNAVLSRCALPVIELSTDWILPLGISFYTFQAIGYLMDVYWEKVSAEKNLCRTALFLSFFPQLVQGPISRFGQLAGQLSEEHRFDYERCKEAAILILWGFFKKLLIAERSAVISNWIFTPENNAGGAYILLGAAAYSLRVYADFSGGIDIARGAAQFLGIELVPNFERPYFAATIGDFWRRWHMTLGAWFRDYVFYPLSLSKGLTKLGKAARKRLGNRIGKLLPVLIAQFVVFTLIGIWHGSSWKYIAFGFYHGILIVGGILLGEKCRKLGEKLHIPMDSLWFQVFQILRTVLLVVFGRILTMGGRLTVSLGYIKSLFTVNNWSGILGGLLQMGLNKAEWLLLAVAVLMLFGVSLMQEKGIGVRKRLMACNTLIQWTVYLILIFMILIFGVYGFGYNSSDFIYRGF